MTRQAARNNAACGRALAALRAKLELLARADADGGGECPCCLEPLGGGRAATTLACCHQVCDECWAQWRAARGARGAFCPLCRNDEFVDFVLQATPASRADVATSSAAPPRRGLLRRIIG